MGEKAIANEAGFKARRWVVERTIAWIGRYRRLSKDYERLPATEEVWVSLSGIRTLFGQLIKATAKAT